MKFIATFYILVLSASFLSIFSNAADDEKGLKTELQVKANNLPKKTMRISGDIVDEKGNPISSVKLEIEKTKIIDFLPKLSGVDKNEEKVVESKFALEFPGWHYVYLTFSKEGYYPVKEKLSSMNVDEREDLHCRDNVKIVLRKIGDLTEGLISGWMQLELDDNDNGKVVKKGWHSDKHNSNETEDIEYTDPKEVDFYIEKDKNDENAIILKANGKGGFYTFNGVAKDLTYLSEAPVEGYVNEIKIKVGENKKYYIYFKTDSGKYGKMKGVVDVNKASTGFTADYILNPGGSKSLGSTEK